MNNFCGEPLPEFINHFCHDEISEMIFIEFNRSINNQIEVCDTSWRF